MKNSLPEAEALLAFDSEAAPRPTIAVTTETVPEARTIPHEDPRLSSGQPEAQAHATAPRRRHAPTLNTRTLQRWLHQLRIARPLPLMSGSAQPWMAALLVLTAVGVTAFGARGVAGGRLSRAVATIGSAARPVASPSGTATFSSTPAGVEVRLAGTVRGITPLTISLPAGKHVVELGNGSTRRTIPVTIGEGTVASYYVDVPATANAEPARSVGSLEIVSDPPRAPVAIDGARRGVTPLTLTDLAAGEHHVTITHNETVISRTVTVVPGSKVTVVASSSAGMAAGWVAIAAPFEMKILDHGNQIGTTASRIMVPAGAHRFDLVNADLNYSTNIALTVTAGGTATATVTAPAGRLSINALPWADVLVDGKPAGTTPLGNLAVPIGTHDIVLRHPQLGEQRRTVVVKANAPARIGVDLNQ